jgi:hypothetical protein
MSIGKLCSSKEKGMGMQAFSEKMQEKPHGMACPLFAM